jgi:hypothetical protein
MAIELPQFEDTFCQMISVCSRISPEFSGPLPLEDVDITASYGATPGRALAHLLWDREHGRHLHLDFALRSAFGKAVPKTDTRLPEFRKRLAAFLGAPAQVHLHGYYLIPLSSLPPTGGLIFAGQSGIKLRVGKSEIELTGASLTFRNADINRIRWDFWRDQVILDIYADRTIPINDAYLSEALHLLDSSISNYVLGKKPDDKTTA